MSTTIQAHKISTVNVFNRRNDGLDEIIQTLPSTKKAKTRKPRKTSQMPNIINLCKKLQKPALAAVKTAKLPPPSVPSVASEIVTPEIWDRTILSMNSYQIDDANHLTALCGHFHLTIGTLLEGVADGIVTLNEGHNREDGMTYMPEWVKELGMAFCFSMLDGIYAVHHEGRCVVIDGNHRLATAMRKSNLGEVPDYVLRGQIKITVIPSHLGIFGKRMMDNKRSLSPKNYSRNSDYLGGLYRSKIIKAIKNSCDTFSTIPTEKEMKNAKWGRNLVRLALFLERVDGKPNFFRIAAQRNQLDKYLNVIPQEGVSLSDEIADKIGEAVADFVWLRKESGEYPEVASYLADTRTNATFMLLIVADCIANGPITSNNEFGDGDPGPLSNKLAMRLNKVKALAAKASHGSLANIQKNYEIMVALLTK